MEHWVVRWQRRAAQSWATVKRQFASTAQPSNWHFEALEPRVLLSATIGQLPQMATPFTSSFVQLLGANGGNGGGQTDRYSIDAPLAETGLVRGASTTGDAYIATGYADKDEHALLAINAPISAVTGVGKDRLVPVVPLGGTDVVDAVTAQPTISSTAAYTLAISGPGTAQMLADGTGFRLQLDGTDATSQVTLQRSPDTSSLILTGITASSPLGAVTAADATLTGSAVFGGAVSRVSIGQVSGGRIEAPSIGTLVANTYAGDLAVTGTGVSGLAVSTVSVGVASGNWQIAGRVGTISAASTASDWHANITGALSQLTTRGDAGGVLGVAALQILQVGGNLQGFALYVGANLGSDAILGGSDSAADTFKAGTLARVRVTGDIVDSLIAVGVDPNNGIYNDGDDSFLGSVTANALQEFAVGGLLRGNTSILAPAFPAAVLIHGVGVDPASVPAFSTRPKDLLAPTLSAALLSDTGVSASDGLTSDPTIAGTVRDLGLVALTARFDPADPRRSAVDVLGTVDGNGGFVLTPTLIAQLAGGVVADGAHSVLLTASDAAGNTTSRTVGFTLDTVAPLLTAIDLDAASDTGVRGDLSTTSAVVTLVGIAEAASVVRLTNLGLAAVADANGRFVFSGLPLALGANSFAFSATDAAGNSTSVNVTVQRTPNAPDTSPPVLVAALVSDTGSSASDGITRDAAITGTATDDVGVIRLLVALDPGSQPTFIDITALIGPGGSFLLSQGLLDTLAGGTLRDGSHGLLLRAADAAGNTSDKIVAFVLDRTAPSLTSLALDAAFDTGVLGDLVTTAATVTLTGNAEPASVVGLQGRTMVADNAGRFAVTDVALLLGANPFTFTATDLAGNVTTAVLTVTRSAVPTDTTSPVVTAALSNDTGSSATDGITRDPAIGGRATDDVAVTRLSLSLDPGATPVFTDITNRLAADGSFSIDATLLNALAGGVLANGRHSVLIRAGDAAGNVGDRTVAFTLDTTGPGLAALGLDPASDTGTLGDLSTTTAVVTLVGQSEAGATIRLTTLGLATTADGTGRFSFAAIALTLGSNGFTFTATDAAGNVSTANLVVQRTAVVGDPVAPMLSAALANDTGLSAGDGITKDPTVSGQATDDVALASVTVALDANGTPVFTDVTNLLAADGRFTLSAAFLATLAGGTLNDGAHSVLIKATDAAGNATSKTVTFVLDRTAPGAATFGIANADALNGDDSQSSAAIVLLTGRADAGSTVSIANQGLSALVSAAGTFQIANVKLAPGANTIALTVSDVAGNTSSVSRTLTRVTATHADAVLDWNSIALQAIQRDSMDPQFATRVLAIQSIAVYDSLAAIEGTAAFLVQRTVTGPVSADAAAVEAAYRVLYQLFPGQRASLDAALATSLGGIADGSAKTAGIALGKSIAEAALAIRANDGYLDFVPDDGSNALGAWRPTGPMYLVAQDPQWGDVTPFVLTSGDEFRAPPPPAIDSAEYGAAVAQVESLGAANSTTRTADQTQQAQFWADGGGSYTPPGHWNQIAAVVAAANGNSLSANARLMAQLNVAMADTAIAAWDTKYTYDVWRPVTAIQNADAAGIPGVTQDANWTSLIIAPPHPSYVSGHASFSAAAADVLAATFGDATSFTVGSSTLPGVTRSFTSFSQAMGESGDSRIYGGIHTRLDTAAGHVLGTQVADAVLARFALAQDTQAPNVVLADSVGAVRTNPTFTGQVLDNLSGVASAQYSIDGGAMKSLSFDALGAFSITTGLALDGSQDGPHTLTIVATDAAGNVSTALARSFILDTRLPTVALTSIAAGATLDASSRLTGAADGTGAALVSVAYDFDGGTSRTIAFDTSSGTFDEALPLRDLGAGSHTLTVRAADAAGNVGISSRTVVVDALPPMTISELRPADGSADVGSTYRPRISFSRAVNPATLTADTLYATGPDGTRLAATIVPADDGSYAWMLFANPLPSGSTITLHIQGSAIRAVSDGTFLDADGDGVAGGNTTTTFTTVSLSPVLGTKVVGRVVDPGADLTPMTFDDIRRGPDGVIETADDVFLNPIAHAAVYILGMEDKVVYTDSQGFFELDDVPVGDVKLAIDGRTATNAPAGVFWPEMVLDLDLKPGIANTAMGSMGTLESQQDNADRCEIYLPRVFTSVMQPVSQTEPTTITLKPEAAPHLTDEQRSELTLTIQPGTAIGFDGKPVSNVTVGVQTVAPEIVKDMLPPGVLQHTFDITIQAPGVSVFTTPQQITFPNVFNAAPGTKLSILSFDHTTGRLVINGTATVSADGKSVSSDEGAGIVAPGWHGLVALGLQYLLDAVDTLKKFREPLVKLSFDLVDYVEDVKRLSLPLVVGIEGGIAGAALGPGGAVAGFNLMFSIAEVSAARTKLIEDSFKEAAKAYIEGKLAGESPEEISKEIKDSLRDVAISKATSIANPYLSYANAWREAIDHARDFGTDLGKVLHPPGGDPDFTAAYLELAAEFGWATPTTDQIADFNLLTGQIPAASDALPTPTVIAYRIAAEYANINNIINSSSIDESSLEKVKVSLDYINANSSIIADYAGAMRKYVGEISSEVNGAIRLRASVISTYSQSSSTTDKLYYLYQTDGSEIRGNATAATISAVLPPDTIAYLRVYDPVTNLVGVSAFNTGLSGTGPYRTPIVFGAPRGPDTDGDGLADAVEEIVGTSLDSTDSDGDGISDAAAIKLGVDPTGGRLLPSGVISSASLKGSVQALDVASSCVDDSQVFAYVATGASGLAIIDASLPTRPVLRSILSLPGISSDVAVDSSRGLAIVASGSAGLQIVDVTNSASPLLLQTIEFDSSVGAVAAYDGLAFVASGASISVLNVDTGEVLRTVDLGSLGGTSITDLAIDGVSLCSIDSRGNLRTFSLDASLTQRGSIVLTQLGGKIFAGGGVVYIGHTDGFNGGFSTVDSSDPSNLKLFSGPDVNNIAGSAIAVNGSGLGVVVGNPGGVFGINELDVVKVTDPTNTAAFVTRFMLPAAPQDVVIANGLAFVADGNGGLQIVNYAALDTKRVAPVVSASLSAVDADTSASGLQVLEGRSFTIKPTVSDDVQIRNVELLVNGVIVATDASFPFDFTYRAPAINVGGRTMTIQVRATDTGGNAGFSTPIVVDVVPDTYPPVLQSASLAEGDRRFFVRSIELTFDEPLDAIKLATTGASVVSAGTDGTFGTADDVVVPLTIDTRSGGQVVSFLPGGYLPPGSYRLTVDPSIITDVAGNHISSPIVRNFTIRAASDIKPTIGVAAISTAPAANPGQQIGIAVPFDPSTAKAQFAVIDASGTKSTVVASVARWDTARGIAYFNVPANAVTGDAVVYSLVGTTRTDFADGTFPLQIIPIITGVQVQSVSADGTSAVVVLSGRGFVEGNNSEYRFGSAVVVDASANTGPDVQQIYDANLGQYVNGQVTLTVPLSNGVFGPITVKTAGGVSASYSVSLGGITATALTGTPANAAIASANPGQAITLTGTGLSTNTDVLIRYTDYNGTATTVQLSPIAAAADGTRATLVIPIYANGVMTLQVFGSTSQPLLQVVPVVTRFDDSGTNAGTLYGAGFVEGATTYNLPGATVADTQIAGGVDVTYYYDGTQYVFGGQANFPAASLPHYGLGNVSVTTAGGTSAAVAINAVRPGTDTAAVGGLADIAVDPLSGATWVLDYINPGHVLRIDPATGSVLQTITMTAGYGAPYTFNYGGLQILGTATTLGGTAVPAGSLLVFNGYANPDRVVAVNPNSGAIVATLTLAGNYDLTAGLYDPTTGHLFVVTQTANQMLELNATTGALINTLSIPLNGQSWAGLAIDPATGNFWLGTYGGGSALVLIDRTGKELRRIDLTSQGVNTNEISGLAFAPDGSLRVSSTQGTVYKVSLGSTDYATQPATLTGVTGSALNGVAAVSSIAAANVGQVIELTGANFGADTQVLFNFRDNTGQTGVLAIKPLAINGAGTRLQVVVPSQATTGDVKVVNSGIGGTNLGFGGNSDAIYRQVTTTFTAGSSTAVVRFNDGGLESLANESWGLDNVIVRQGATTVFQDDFEGGAKANWSDATTNVDERGVFSQFSGRFNNQGQTLNLTGLVAGQTYTVRFDLYVLDGWDGSSASYGPDVFQVSADGTTVFRETFANVNNSQQGVQTYGDSAGIRLQIVPTLTSLSGAPGQDALFNLSGSGFMEGATTITVGGVALSDPNTIGSPFDVTGTNDTINVVAPRTLDGPVRITTAGGYAELPGVVYANQPLVQFSSITAVASSGTPADVTKPSAVSGQTITITGQGLTSSTLVQFQGIDDTGRVGTLTRTGTASSDGKTLTVVVPALARTGVVTVLGSGTSIVLQIVPTVRAIGGTVAAGNTLILEGTGLTANDLAIQIDGRGVGSFTVRTINDGISATYLDQQLLTLTVPVGVGAGVITISTAGGSTILRSAVTVTALADQTPTADVGGTLATAFNTGLGLNQSVKVSTSIATGLDVDLYRVDLAAGDVLTLTVANASSLYDVLRIFDATGTQQLITSPYLVAGTTTSTRFTAPTAGTYYVGMSSYNNIDYNPTVAGSGTNGGYTGSYVLSVERLPVSTTSRLSGIVASAASGTAAVSGVAAANVGQTITLNGTGLLSTDRVIFSLLDDSGNLYESAAITPLTVGADGKSLTVVVPAMATTGRVRIDRDLTGILLQIVPTLSDVNETGGFAGGSLTLSGTGFAEGASSVLFGTQRVDDLGGRYYGLDTYSSNTRLGLTVPENLPTGPIRVVTVGGTSAAFGVSLTSITATAITGVATNAGQAAVNPGQTLTLNGVGFDATLDVVFQVIDYNGALSETIVRPSTVNAAGTQVQVTVPVNAITGTVRVVGDLNNAAIALQVIPIVSDVQVQSVSADGTSAVVVLTGRGFVEGNNSEYRFGSGVVVDANANAGPEVLPVYDASLGQYVNGQVTLTVALSNGVFGPITVKTAGGASAAYSVSLGEITATALTGTPANAAIASANPGQAITLTGTGLSTNTDVLLRYTDYNGSATTVQLSPIAAAADGTRATLVLPIYVNGVMTLQVFGSTSQPVLQVVPVVTRFDDGGTLYGAGFVEGATTYNLPGATVADTQITGGVDVTYFYDGTQYVFGGQANFPAASLPHYGLGNVSVTTAGGTSAGVTINTVRPGTDTAAVGTLGDIAVDPLSGATWVLDYVNPGHVLRIDPATGSVLQTITMTAGYGTPYTFNYGGLQILGTAITLGGTAVPAGSLLVFNGYASPDRVIAVNPNTGALVATLTLGDYDLTAGLYDPTTGHVFVVTQTANQMLELNATTGALLNTLSIPLNGQSWAGLAIDPATGNFWLGTYGGSSALVLIDRTGKEIRRIDLTSQGVNTNEISGLAFAPDGSLRVASTQGTIYKVALGATDYATQPATLAGVTGSALNGVAAQAGVAAANVGQVIELTGTNFGANTQVLFNFRDNTGQTGVLATKPLSINSAGTRLQVVVPSQATTGDVKVVNSGAGASNLGFSSSTDAIYRQVTTSFVAGSSTAVVRFSDGGLQALDDESWGLDNVVVRQGGTTIFQDGFEGGAKANWGNAATNTDAKGVFSEFSGRFNNQGQTLSLTGLVAGQTYTVSFDLYVLDSWEGSSPTAGPDVFQVSADGTTVFRESFANTVATTAVQTYGDSAGIRLQIVPTLTSLSGAPGQDALFNLSGSGFMEGATTITVGGVAFSDPNTIGSPFDVTGTNDTINVVAPRTLDGPVRITTEGGYAELPGVVYANQPLVQFSSITATATSGTAADGSKPSAVSGQSIVITGQGLTSSTLVQFQGIDDSGRLGTLTRTGSASSDGKTLSVVVPALARTGVVTVLGSSTGIALQIVPTLRAIGGTVVAGNTLILEGTGLTANDLSIQIDGRGVGSFTVRTINDGISATYLDQQLLTLTVPVGVGAGVITISTAGGSTILRTAVTVTTLADQAPAADVGGTLATALNTGLGSNQSLKITTSIANGLDVDLYRVDLGANEVLSLTMTNAGSLYDVLRIFDVTGRQVLIASPYFNAGATSGLRWSTPAAGTYYVGLSSYNNVAYDPTVAGSGISGSYAGTYTLNVERLSAGSSSRLSGITATAASGTAAVSGVAAANVGQTITLNGTGLLSTDRVIFSLLDDSGNLYESAAITPLTVGADGKSLTVVVPAMATTGRVRIDRDLTGILLQIVPTLSDVNETGGFAGGSLTLSGTGFAEGASSVLFGTQRVDDLGGRYYGLDTYSSNTRLQLTVPENLPTGPIRVSTVGGTSAAFGVSLTSITATAGSGTAANTALASVNPGQTLTLNGTGFDATLDVVFQVIDSNGIVSETIVRPGSVNAGGTQALVTIPINAISGAVRVVGDSGNAALTLQVIPTITGVDVQSVAADGSSAVVVLSGRGFVEGNNSEYRFGSGAAGALIVDANANAGPDVSSIYDAVLGQYVNGQVTLTVSLSNGVFGPITVKTAGGTSAVFAIGLNGIVATATTGTPANAALASANPGQTITLTGTGLATTTDVLIRYTDYNGVASMVSISPTTAATDGTRATLVLPIYVNGAFALQVFGSTSQPVLQIVPVLTRFDASGSLYGAGFVEGATTYALPGITIADSQITAGADVSYYYDGTQYVFSGLTNFPAASLPHYGLGNVSVTTAGGTSASLALNTLRPGSDTASTGNLGDIAIDPASGAMWVLDSLNPGHILRLDPTTGLVLQTITMTAAYGTPYTINYGGLQILSTAITLAGTAVPAGSLLVFNGYTSPDRVLAVNPTTGAIIATLTLSATTGNYDLTAGLYDPTTGHLFVLSSQANRMIELNATTGAEIARTTLPINISSYAGLAIDPATGNFWVGSTGSGTVIVLVNRSGVEVRRIDLAGQGVGSNVISGLAFAVDGTLRIASTQGTVYKVSVTAGTSASLPVAEPVEQPAPTVEPESVSITSDIVLTDTVSPVETLAASADSKQRVRTSRIAWLAPTDRLFAASTNRYDDDNSASQSPSAGTSSDDDQTLTIAAKSSRSRVSAPRVQRSAPRIHGD